SVVDRIGDEKCVGVAASEAHLWSRAGAEIGTVQGLPRAVNAAWVISRAARYRCHGIEDVVLTPGSTAEGARSRIIGCTEGIQTQGRTARVGLLLSNEVVTFGSDVCQGKHGGFA